MMKKLGKISVMYLSITLNRPFRIGSGTMPSSLVSLKRIVRHRINNMPGLALALPLNLFP